MPIYEYRCQECDHVFEEWHRGYEEKEVPCPVCEGKAKRLISNTAFILKGSGFYATDYAGSKGKEASGDGGNGEAKSEGQESASADKGESSAEKSASGNGGDSGGKEGKSEGGASQSSQTTTSSSNSE